MNPFVKLPIDESLDTSNFVLTRANNADSEVSFAGIRYSPPAEAATPPNEISKADPSRVKGRAFCLVLPNVDAKITKKGVAMPGKFNPDTGKYDDQPWSISASAKQELTLSLDPSVESHKLLLDTLHNVNDHIANQYAARHNMHRTHVINPAVARSSTFELSDGTQVMRQMLKLSVTAQSSFRFNKSTHYRDALGVAGPFFKDGNKVGLLAITPAYVLIQQRVSEEDESIFHYTVSVKWVVHFADVGQPALREDGRSYAEAQQDYVQSMKDAEAAVVDELSSYCEKMEEDSIVEAPVPAVEVTPPAPQTQSRLGVANGSGVSKKRPVPVDLPHESKLAVSHEPQGKKKKARRVKPPQGGDAAEFEASVSGSKAPPSLAHLLG